MKGAPAMSPELITAIVGVGGLAAIIPKIVEGVAAYRSGRAVSEKGRNQSLLARVGTADRRAENEADFRRKLEEYAGALRLMLIELGVPAHKLPPWPVRKDS